MIHGHIYPTDNGNCNGELITAYIQLITANGSQRAEGRREKGRGSESEKEREKEKGAAAWHIYPAYLIPINNISN
jgi:hypothetical protein